jgi:hypothetical protein
MEHELIGTSYGTVSLQIRGRVVGKFELRQSPIETSNGVITEDTSRYTMTVAQWLAFKDMAMNTVGGLSEHWTHGEILFEYLIKQNSGTWGCSISIVSVYNLQNMNVSHENVYRLNRSKG